MNCILYNNDCYEILKTIPDKSIDLIVTDPPYKIVAGGFGGAFGVEKRNYHLEVSKNEQINNGIDNSVLEQFIRISKKLNCYIWCNKNQILQFMEFFRDYNVDLLAWHKTNPIPTCNNKYLSDTEYCLFFREDGVKIYGTYETKRKFWCTETNKADKEYFQHPTIKPINIIKTLVSNSSKEGETVLDCFMGSGTTGVACKDLNRNFIGIELEKKWYDIAEKRINDHVVQPELFKE